MPDVATLGIKIENGDIEKATTSLDKMEVAGAKAERAASTLSRRMGLAQIEAQKMDTALRQSAHGAEMLRLAMVGTSVIAAAGFIGHKTIEETEQAQAAMAQLEAAVASTGGVAGRTVQQLDELSMSLQRQTTYSDEAVKGAEAMLLTFDKIRGTEFDRATAAVTDLAARMGGDLQGAAIQVGKALQDPTTGLTALRRSGVSFSESQIELIKHLYEAGQAAEGQQIILKELEHQFGGSAAAARDTLGGALAGLKNAFGDLFELTKDGSQGTVDAINGITHAMETSGVTMNNFLTEWMSEWAQLKAGISEVWAILSTPITADWAANVRKQIDAIEFDLSTKLAAIHTPAKHGAAAGASAAGGGDDETAAAKHRREANEDMVREARQAAELAALEGRAQQMMRIDYEETNKVIKAQRELKGDLLNETLKAIHEEADYKRGAVENERGLKYAKDVQDIWEKGVTDLMNATERGVHSMLESLGSLVQSLLARMKVEGQTNSRLFGAGIAIAGFGAGYDARSAGSGLVGGAAAGASMGMMGGPIGVAAGTALGALAGLAGGILGAAEAARAARAEMKSFHDSLDQIRAELRGDALAGQLAQIATQFDTLRVEAEKLSSGWYAIVNSAKGTPSELEKVNALEAESIAKAKELAALQAKQYAEDLQVRLLRAEGHDKEAQALALELQQQREREALIKSFGDTIDPAEAATLALLEQVQAQEKLKAATDAASTSALNMVQGYKLQATIFGAMTPRSGGAQRGGASTSQVIENIIVLDSQVVARSSKRVYKDEAQRRYGDETRWSET